jgi:hypothetical protein
VEGKFRYCVQRETPSEVAWLKTLHSRAFIFGNV